LVSDWSSDVCSSDLRDQVEDGGLAGAGAAEERGDAAAGGERGVEREAADAAAHVELKHRGRRRAPWRGAPGSRKPSAPRARGRRSEERRVGKEARAR